jgi:hypothetical protein
MTTDNLIKWSTVLAVAAVAIVAGWVSYVHALDVVTAHGEHGALAHLYPGTIDGLIYSASMVLLDAARRDVKAPRLAYWLLGVGITVTLVANVLAGVAFGVLGAVVAAWPALALVGSYELLMIMIRRARTAPEVDDVPQAVSVPTLDDVAETVTATTADAVPTPVPEAVAGTVARRARRRPLDHARKAERKYADDLAEGRLPSLRAVMRDIGVGQDKAREVRAHLVTLATANGTVDHG